MIRPTATRAPCTRFRWPTRARRAALDSAHARAVHLRRRRRHHARPSRTAASHRERPGAPVHALPRTAVMPRTSNSRRRSTGSCSEFAAQRTEMHDYSIRFETVRRDLRRRVQGRRARKPAKSVEFMTLPEDAGRAALAGRLRPHRLHVPRPRHPLQRRSSTPLSAMR